MDLHAQEFYRSYSEEASHGHFHRVIALHEDPLIAWSDVQKLAPRMGRGWYELAQLSSLDRIEFAREFWLVKLPYRAHLSESIVKFFGSLDDIGIFLTQKSFDDPFEGHLVYSLAEDSGFFHGEIPASEKEIIRLQKDFPNTMLPADYLNFLQIHNGFAKLSDSGIIPSTMMKDEYQAFQKMIAQRQEPVATVEGINVDPKSLIPFYKSFDTPFFQCFWGEWYPDQEMGNVYFSGLSGTVSACQKKDDSVETMAFETFTDWLMFYLEKID